MSRPLCLTLILVGSISLLAACGKRAPTAPAPGSTPATKAAPRPRPAPTPASLLPRLGFAAVPEPVPASAREANAEGVRLHRAGKHAEARARFEEALREVPGYGLARFNLACAQSKAGQQQAAAHALEGALEQDLARFGPLWREDADLAALRGSEPGRALAARVRELTAAVGEAVRRGVPALLWDGDANPWGLLKPRYLRAGVYLHETRRFYPLAPALRGATAALFDPGKRLVAQVHPTLSESCGVHCHPFEEVELTVEPALASSAPRRWSAGQLEAPGLLLQLTSGLRFLLRDCSQPRCRSSWFVLGERGKDRDAEQGEGDGPTLSVDNRGAALTALPPGYHLRKGKLERPEGKPIALPKQAGSPDYTTAVLSPDGKSLLLALTSDRCECGRHEGPVFKHAVVRVDLEAGEAAVVLEGDGPATVRADGVGGVILQTGSRRWRETKVQRWPSVDKVGPAPGDKLPPGVFLVPPRTEETECCSA